MAGTATVGSHFWTFERAKMRGLRVSRRSRAVAGEGETDQNGVM